MRMYTYLIKSQFDDWQKYIIEASLWTILTDCKLDTLSPVSRSVGIFWLSNFSYLVSALNIDTNIFYVFR